ncbi:vWA domain-containing protein [Bacillus sp. JJ1764]|uniref:vWA domain-containing protein n=1 Tax=Bacillus sp. JJ1764 TaxID=3122964 RepID=UPI002FFF2F23
MLVPSTLVMLFAAGLLFQFFYSINFSSVKPPDDFVVVLDTSGSMNKTDPNHESLKAAARLIDGMKSTHRAAVISFNDQANLTKPMFSIGDKPERGDAIAQINGLEDDGGTNIGRALDLALKEINSNRQNGRKPMVILFSDGYSKLDFSKVIEPYQREDIVINTVGMSKIDWGGAQLLKKIASKTGGSFHDVKNADELSKVFEKIYLDNQDRLLIDERFGVFQDSTYLAILRVILLNLLGGLFGLSLGILFDNRYLAKSYAITGLVSGVLAGLVLESGLFSGFYNRLFADLLLTVVTGLGTILIPIREKFSSGVSRHSGDIDFSIRGTKPQKDNIRKSF